MPPATTNYQDLRGACHTFLRKLCAVNRREIVRLRKENDEISVGLAQARIDASRAGGTGSVERSVTPATLPVSGGCCRAERS